MKVLRLFPSDSYDFSLDISQSLSVLPLYGTHSEAQQDFFEQLLDYKTKTYVIFKDNTPTVFLSIKDGQLLNLLTPRLLTIGWQFVFDCIENISKRSFERIIIIKFYRLLTEPETYRLFKQGYQIQGNRVASKELTYHTALVLGGGGARGAYQIGVWQALKEQEISIRLITGTSVGALNGALIIQDDLEEARTMWERIETNQILSFPMKERSSNTFSDMLSQIASFTIAAIQTRGVSTQPLQQLLKDTFSQEKLNNAVQDFYLVTTELPGVTEKVIHFNTCKDQQWQQWLLASSSFFPAMAAANIDGKYYVDGGYKNNIPADVALANGGTESIIVDVKGPGYTKRISFPDAHPVLYLKTPWSLGTVLLFDGARSAVNIQLGYFEMMKALEKYSGYWYTFSDSVEVSEQLQEKFFKYLRKNYQLSLWKNREQRKKFYQKLRKYYKDRVYEENISMALLELLGKSADLLPNRLYTFAEFIQSIKNQTEKTAENDFLGMVSVQEWMGRYYEEFFLLSERRQLQLLTDFLSVEKVEKNQRLKLLFDRFPVMVLLVLLKEFIREEGEDN
ncbi:patatin-like phospholipase family protein [Enterococcus sp. LJL128]|uniref:patatin-like phospholipase family protein n=1 Tax=Enterococcus sp. LJL51 TaxID=3416656 RepID=UPI003CF941F9